MTRLPASRIVVRAALAALLVSTLSAPVSAGGASVNVTITTSSPAHVTIGKVVAYPITVQNIGKNTLNTVFVSGEEPAGFTYLGAAPSTCSQTTDSCSLGQIPSGAPASTVTFYYRVTSAVAPGTYQYIAHVDTSEGTTDNSDGTSNNVDHWSDDIVTIVSTATNNFVAGHAVINLNTITDNTFTTGLDTLSATNKHGTTLVLRSFTEATVRDITAAQADAFANCQTLFSSVCFGEASQLQIGTGGPVTGGVQVTMRWDYSDQPNGMTEKKIHIVHIFDGGTSFEQVTNQCTFGTGPTPTNMPCLQGAPIRLADKDIQATMWWNRNGIGRGW